MRRGLGIRLAYLLGAIIAAVVVASLVTPILQRTRCNADMELCASHLRTIAKAIAMYEDDYDAIMPWALDTNSWSWTVLAYPYLRPLVEAYHGDMSVDLFELTTCPSTPIEIFTIGPYSTYGYNSYLGKMKQAHPLAVAPVKVKYPALTLRITETCTYDPEVSPGSAGESAKGTFAPVPDWKAAGLSKPLYAPGWHGGKNNVLWVDGHVSTMTKEEVMRTDSNPDPNVWARLSPKPKATDRRHDD
jgi:prepilin-type processing-associated H-X9-DG protein